MGQGPGAPCLRAWARRLGTRRPTAWLLKHKLVAAPEAAKPRLEGRIGLDHAYLAGSLPGGRRGHGAAGSNVVTDGLSCWTAVEQVGCGHFPQGHRPGALQRVNITLPVGLVGRQ